MPFEFCLWLQKITDGAVKWRNLFYHEGCFLCFMCKQPLLFDLWLQRLTEGHLQWGMNTYRRACFCCSVCKQQLFADACTSPEKSPVCLTCFSTNYTDICTSCHSPISQQVKKHLQSDYALQFFADYRLKASAVWIWSKQLVWGLSSMVAAHNSYSIESIYHAK